MPPGWPVANRQLSVCRPKRVGLRRERESEAKAENGPRRAPLHHMATSLRSPLIKEEALGAAFPAAPNVSAVFAMICDKLVGKFGKDAEL